MIDLSTLLMLCNQFNVSYFEITANAPFTADYLVPASYVYNFIDSDNNRIK